MAEEVGGISVSFTAEASRLRSELERLEQQLRRFDSAHGRKRVQLEANLQAPGQRALLDFRRDIGRRFSSDPALALNLRPTLEAPTGREAQQFAASVRRSIGDRLTVRVVGNFEWGQRPPDSITIPVTGGGGPGGAAGAGGVATTTAGRNVSAKEVAEQRTESRKAAQAAVVVSGQQQRTRGTAPAPSAPIAPSTSTGTVAAVAGAVAGAQAATAPPAARRAAVGRAPSANIARAAAQTPTATTSEVFRDYTNEMLLEDLGTSPRGHAGRIREELQRRGVSAPAPPAAGRPTARGLTGGATGAFGYGVPAVAPWATTGASVPHPATVAAMGRRGELTMPIKTDYDPYRRGGPAPAKIGIEQARGLDEERLAESLRRVMRAAPPEAVAAGTGWYQRAGELTQSMGAGTGLGRPQVAAATAVFSQNAAWPENVRNAQDFFEALKRGARTVDDVEHEISDIRKGTGMGGLGLRARTQSALDVAAAPDQQAIDRILGGPTGLKQPKIRAFQQALMGDPNQFVVDRHMAMMMSGAPVTGDQRVHAPFQRAGRKVASEMGVSAADLQAIAWVTGLGHEIAGADPYQMRARVPSPATTRARPRAAGLSGEFEARAPVYPLTAGYSQRMTGTPTYEPTRRELEGMQASIMEPVAAQARATEMHARLQPEWGGFTQVGGRFLETDPRRKRGPYVSGVGETVSLPRGATPAQIARGRQELLEVNAGLRADVERGRLGIGGFADESRGRTELDVVKVDETAREARATQRGLARGGGAYEVATGSAVWGRPSDALRQDVRMAVRGEVEAARATPARLPHEGRRAQIQQQPRMLQAAMPPLTLEQLPPAMQAQLQQGAGGAGGGGEPPSPPPGAEPPTPPEEPGLSAAERRRMLTANRPGELAAMGLQRRQLAGMQAVRAPGTTMANQIATFFGGRAEWQQNLQMMSQLETQMQGIFAQAPEEFQRLAEASVELDRALTLGAAPERLDELANALDSASKAVAPFEAELKPLRDEWNRIAQTMSGPRQAVVNFSSAITGSLIGMGAFAAGTAAIGGAVAGIATIAKPAIDAMTGWRSAAESLGDQLGDLTRQQSGMADRAVSAQFVQAGLGETVADTIRPIMEQRAAVEAGNDALKDQIALIRASQQFQTQMGRAEAGLPIGPLQTPGGVPGISATTGGWFGSPIMGRAPMWEQILQDASGYGSVPERAMAGAGGLLLGGATGALAGAFLGGAVGGVGAVPGAIAGGIAGMVGFGPRIGDQTAANMGMFSPEQLPRDLQFQYEQARASHGRFGVRGAIGGALGFDMGPAPEEVATFGDIIARGTPTDQQIARWAGFADTLSQLHDNVVKVDEALADAIDVTSLVGRELPQGEREALLDQMESLLTRAGLTEDQIAGARMNELVALDRATGRIMDIGQFREVEQAAARGASIPSASELARQLERPLSAALQMVDWQGTIQRQTMIPGQAFLGQLAAGRVTPGGNMVSTGTRSVPPEVAAQFGVDTSHVVRAQEELEAVTQRGAGAMRNLVQEADAISGVTGPNSLTRQFNALTSSAAATAQTIRAINRESAWAQVNLQVAQINEQIRVMGQSLADARSFISGAPSAGPGGGQLGVLQHRARALERSSAALGFQQQSLGLQSQALGLQNAQLGIRSRELGFQSTQLQFQSRELGFQSTQLNLMQRQRQINFQRAMAGFATPGASSEEIAARVREAEIEADFAQRQQNIAVQQFDLEKQSLEIDRQQLPIAQAQLEIDRQQVGLQAQQLAMGHEALALAREQFGVQQAMIDVQAARAVETLSRQIALLREQARVTVMVQVNADAVADYQSKLSAQMSEIESIVQQAFGATSTIAQHAATMVATVGGYMSAHMQTLTEGYRDYIMRLNRITREGIRDLRGGATSGGGGGGGLQQRYASGFYGSVSAPTQMLVGEAGPETIAILRNPRNLTVAPGEGGGAPTIIVQVYGNNIGGTQQDAEQLAAIVARRVEETMSRRASLLGLRSV